MPWSSEPAELVEQQRLGAEIGHRLERHPHRVGIAVLVIVLAPGQHRNALAAQRADQQIATMAADLAAGKALELGVGD